LKIFKIILASIILLIISFNGNAITVEEYEKLKDTPNAVKEITMLVGIVGEMGDSMLTMNAKLVSLGRQEIYCQPEKMSMNGYNYVQIMEKEILNQKKIEKKSIFDVQKAPIDMMLLDGLIETFPCPNK
jgi:hypothetical protein